MPRVNILTKSKPFVVSKLASMTALGTFSLFWKKYWGQLTRENATHLYQTWANDILQSMGATLHIEGTPPPKNTPCLLLGNHMSYLDIPLMWTATEAVFVSKAEIKNWFMIGSAAESLGTIFVQRSSASSRAETLKQIANQLVQNKNSVCMFPEGTSSIEGKPWKRGAFRIAKEFNIPIYPFRLFYSPTRAASFIDQDSLVPHAWKLLDLKNFDVYLKFFEPISVTNIEIDLKNTQALIQNSVNELLKKEKKYDK